MSESRPAHRSEGGRRDAYCPFDVSNDSAPLYGLVEERHSTQFGALRIARSAQQRSATCVLLIHGVGGRWETWTPLLDASNLVRDADLVLVDLPGFGASQNLPGHLRSREVGPALLDVVERLGYEGAHLVGHSMGGFLSLDMASTGDTRILSVASIAGAYLSVVRAVQRPVTATWSTPSVALVYGALTTLAWTGRLGRESMRALHRLGLLPFVIGPFVKHPWRLAPRALASLSDDLRPASFLLAAANGEHYDAAVEWALIDCPVAVVFGEADELVPEADMIETMKLLPHAQVDVVRDASHLLHIERPYDVAEAIDAFWSGRVRGRSRGGDRGGDFWDEVQQGR